ncbi:PaaI family thioesterase [Loktanella sp. S4079]|uniref:PaaI family thioesterase n=1 Tax=Loktanella sp. S4079 TaxID=579483 RepID=UPI0005FA4D6E|nr:PaaI family thioesterase [Loktanella sp. S4079]KJZ19549.1 thioesterase [Loktanella sp. S4079]
MTTTPYAVPDRDRMLSMSGLDYLYTMLKEPALAAPIGNVINYWLDAVEPGKVVIRGKPEPQHMNTMGGVHGGWYGTLLDSCMACAVMTAVPKGAIYTTLEYKVNLTRAIPVGTEIIATGYLDHGGRTTGVSHGEIRGAADGKLYATGSTTCLIMQIRND